MNNELPIIDEPLDLTAIRGRLASSGQRQFWRSLEEVAETPEFENYLHREFTSQAETWSDDAGRRKFLKLMGASLALAGVTGCTSEPTEKIVPYVRAPHELVPGKPQFYATALTQSGYGFGVLVESHMGRPTKIEGNPEHPASLGATDAATQAAILSLYDPDRSQTILRRGVIETWDTFITAMGRELETLQANRGAGLRILTETVTSPTLAAHIGALLETLPEARWHVYEPAGFRNSHLGSEQAVGTVVDAVYDFRRARVVVALDADFLSTFPGSTRYVRDFTDGRRVSRGELTMSRLFAAESTPTITGAAADHRIAVRPSQVEAIAREILSRVRGGSGGPIDGVSEAWLSAAIADLRQNRGASIVIAGPGQPAVVHALAMAINDALGNNGQTITYLERIAAEPTADEATLAALVDDMQAGRVTALVMLGGNPVYNAPGSLNFSAALGKVPLRVHLSEYADETSFLSDWHIPAAHSLEAWGDVRAFDGTPTIQQPLIAPLYAGKTALELVAVLQGNPGRSAYDILQEHWKKALGEDGFEHAWRKAVHDGVVVGQEARTASPSLVSTEVAASPPVAILHDDELEIEFRTDPSIGDGRYSNNGWLQELPKPLTKITWDNVAAISPATAQRLGLASKDVVDVVVGDRVIQAPVWVQPGQSDNCVSLTFGYGRTQSGRIGTGVGYNAYELLPVSGAWFTRGTLRKTGGKHSIATTQQHHSMEGRDIVRVATLQQIQDDPKHPFGAGHHEHELPTLLPQFEYNLAAWGMSIDQSACIGCNACVVACQAENNIPVVGKEQVEVGREMHWLRIDRYYYSDADQPATVDSPETYFQPMLCQHCEQAPCEVVCPVAATVHDSEGTSNMVYNRCVGTRYCSNNCPYKVRRFNFLQFSDDTTPSLKLMRNPDVTVRNRGVMEKCSFCIQRISHARIDAKKENRPIRDGEVVTACQQACASQAIVFGDLNDPKAAVVALKHSPLNYAVLAEVGARPRTTYLAKVVNSHPDLPDPSAAKRHDPHAETEHAHS